MANSMQTTPLETVEVVNWLKDQGRIDQDLIDKLKKCIADFRLDVEISTGRNSSFRRTYTCPFFKDQSLGCSIAPEVKPYGCLGFNPKKANIVDGEDCISNIELLNERDLMFSVLEQTENAKLVKELSLSWGKLPFPNALLDVMERKDLLP